jgi:hypothetical protein
MPKKTSGAEGLANLKGWSSLNLVRHRSEFQNLCREAEKKRAMP